MQWRSRLRLNLLIVAAIGCLPSCAWAEALPRDAEVDEVLDALHARGEGLTDFRANVRLIETDQVTMFDSARRGEVRFQNREDVGSRIRVILDRRERGEQLLDEKIEYLLDDGWLTERDYQRRVEVRRQVLRPGERMNLLRLGEGPFPLPIGQDKRDVHEQFEVVKVDLRGDDPEDTIRLRLTPRPGTQFERQFHSIDVWVDLQSHMPRKIETVDAHQVQLRTTELEDIRVNGGLGDADFALPRLEGDWDRHDEPFVE